MFKFFLYCSVFICFQQALAGDFTQQLKYFGNNSSTAVNTGQSFSIFSYRLNASETSNDFSAVANYELNTINNSGGIYADIDKHRLFNLSDTLASSNDRLSFHRLDRFFLTYKTSNTISRIGRQAVTWGNGFVFNNIDIFNPFSPLSLDKEYKTGDDMIYFQALDNRGDDWQLIYLPRRNDSGDISSHESSTAVKYHSIISDTEIDIMLAYHYDDNVFGLGISHAVADSLWRLDLTHTQTRDNANITTLVTNIDYSWVFLGRNIYGFLELYHNGFGNKDTISIDNINLNSRIQRGEIFMLFRNYLAGGLTIELHPLLSLAPTLIQDIDNNTTSLITSLIYNLKQNLVLSTALSHYYTTEQEDSNSLNLLLSYYF